MSMNSLHVANDRYDTWPLPQLPYRATCSDENTSNFATSCKAMSHETAAPERQGSSLSLQPE
jgi:hypothetical protein